MPDAHERPERSLGAGAIDEAQPIELEQVACQVLAAAKLDDVGGHVHGRDVLALAERHAQTGSLSDGVCGRPGVTTRVTAVGVHHDARQRLPAAPILERATDVPAGTKHSSWLSGLAAVTSPSSVAMARTCCLVRSPRGNRLWASWSWRSPYRK